MLGRAANSIFWMFRYLERAENTARLIDAGFRMALTRDAADASAEWRSVVITLGLVQSYEAKFGKDCPGPQVINFLLRDKDNPGNVRSMIEAARTNAREVRAGITRELWEAVNEGWMAINAALVRPVREATLREVLDTIRRHATLVRGAMDGTMLRNENFNFARVGSFLERADNVARILDVKYHVLLPSVSYVGSRLDNVQWDMVLRSVSGERAYRWLNAGRMDPAGIARFMILDGRFPRSLAFCYAKIHSNLGALALEYHSESPCHEILRNAISQLHNLTIEQIFDRGLHEFISEFLARNQSLALQIARDFRFQQ